MGCTATRVFFTSRNSGGCSSVCSRFGIPEIGIEVAMVRLCTLRFLERTVARVTVTTLLQRGYSRQRNVGECTAEA